MLINLHVKDLAIIDEIEVDFTKHLNILSGETGAGKSIIIGSINIALGGKVPADIIRKGSEYGLVELVFQIEDPAIVDRVKELDLPIEEDGQIILSRKIMRGRSVCKVNGETVPVSVVRELSGYLIDIHGQHEHQSLLYKTKHLAILDHFAKNELEHWKAKVVKGYQEYQKIKEQLSGTNTSAEDRIREMSFLEYEMNEIEAAQLKKGEEEELDVRYRKLCNMETIIENLSGFYQIMSGSSDSVSVQLGRAAKFASKASEADEEVRDFQNQLEDIDCLVSDLNRELHSFISGLNYDEQELREIEERLDLIHRLKAKYGNSIESIFEYYEKAKEKYENFQKFEEYKAELEEKLNKCIAELDRNCEQMSKIRKKHAKHLAEEIYQALIELNFLNVQFEIRFEKIDGYTSNGYDSVEFYISTNPGEDLKPLGKVASGGELSRVMLAIKSVLADNDVIDTLIFDEIDVGVSGRTAQKVSERLSFIANKHQVMCITHLPQIAAMADAHYIIEKTAKENVTTTSIRLLKEEESIHELARILGGAIITDTVLQSAKEMKELASKTKIY